MTFSTLYRGLRTPLFAALLFPLSLLLSTIAYGQDSATTPAEGLSPESAKLISELLADEQARGALLGELDRIAAKASGTGSDAAPGEPEPEISLGRRIAEATQDTAQSLAVRGKSFVQRFSQLPATLSRIGDIPADVFRQAVIDLFLVVIGTVLLFSVLRRFAKRLYRNMGSVAVDASALRTGTIITASVIIDALVVVLAWAFGYVLALSMFGEAGSIGIRQTLYLNAFLSVEMVKVVLRAILSPTTSALRPVSLPDRGAKVLARWLSIVVSIIGYGQLLIVPIVNQNISFLTGSAVSMAISALALLILMGVVLRYRRAVASWLHGNGSQEENSMGLLKALAHYWHVPVMVYLVGVLAIVLTRPGGILFPVLGASGKIAAAAIIGMVVSNLLQRTITSGVHLPGNVSSRLPLLEGRLNAFVPRALSIVRFAIIVAVLAYTVDTIRLIDVQGWLESQVGVDATATLLSVVMIVFVSFLIWLAISSWVDYRLNPDYGSVPTSREQTLLSLLRNAVTIVLIVITLMFVLSEIGIDIAPLIASAGVLGLAIGFGAQKMVQDIITGIFIQFENAMNVGDVVTVGATTGTVERLTIRSVSLRDAHGTFHIIPFSSVDMVSNYMREFAFYVCDMGVAYRENLEDVEMAMKDAFAELKQVPEWAPSIIGELQWFGLHAFGDNAVVVRARIKTQPGSQWGVGRAYNAIVKRIFDERGIEIPFPHQTVYFGTDREGKAPAANLNLIRDDS